MTRFDTGTTLTYANAKAVLDNGLAQIASGTEGADCTRLTQFDSSALAVLLAWQRAARARATSFSIVNLPAGLNSLARAYGVQTLIESSRH